MKTILRPEPEIFQFIANLYTEETGRVATDNETAFQCWYNEHLVLVMATKLLEVKDADKVVELVL